MSLYGGWRWLRSWRIWRWLHRNAGVVALVAVGFSTLGGIWAYENESNNRISNERTQRIENAVTSQETRRDACKAANARNADIYVGVKATADASHTAPAEYQPLTLALAPRNCASLYPPPSPQGKIPRGYEDKELRFPTCIEAREAGMTPVFLGQPGYRLELDVDGDGIACE